MPDQKFEGRLMVLESIVNTEIPAIKKYMEEGQKMRIAGAEKLAEIGEYVKTCNIDREDLQKRTTIMEKRINYQSGAAAAITFILTLAGSWKFWRG